MEAMFNTRRAKVGDALLAKAKMVDIRPVKARLSSFEKIHANYCQAQRKVEEAERARDAMVQDIERLDAAQMNAIEALAVGLINDGEPRFNPFERFTSLPPGKMKGLLYEEEIKAVRQMATAVKDNKSLSPTTKALAEAAEQAAANLEAALPEMAQQDRNLETVRQMRDPLERAWDTELAVLRTVTRAVSRAEAPGLFANLFGHTTRTAPKATVPAPPQTSTPVAADPPASTVA